MTASKTAATLAGSFAGSPSGVFQAVLKIPAEAGPELLSTGEAPSLQKLV